MPEEVKFEIKSTEIQEIIQLSKLQGGSKHRQADIYKLLDRVVANGPLPRKTVFAGTLEMPKTTIICPYCGAENKFEQYQCVATCKGCQRGVFRSVKE